MLLAASRNVTLQAQIQGYEPVSRVSDVVPPFGMRRQVKGGGSLVQIRQSIGQCGSDSQSYTRHPKH